MHLINVCTQINLFWNETFFPLSGAKEESLDLSHDLQCPTSELHDSPKIKRLFSGKTKDSPDRQDIKHAIVEFLDIPG